MPTSSVSVRIWSQRRGFQFLICSIGIGIASSPTNTGGDVTASYSIFCVELVLLRP